MPDLTMCDGEKCPFKEECYRYKATPSKNQSYFSPTPLQVVSHDGKTIYLCEHHMQINGRPTWKINGLNL